MKRILVLVILTLPTLASARERVRVWNCGRYNANFSTEYVRDWVTDRRGHYLGPIGIDNFDVEKGTLIFRDQQYSCRYLGEK